MKLFRDLNHDETMQFQAWARAHYEAFTPIDGAWHPVVQAECAKINAEKGANVSAAQLLGGVVTFKQGNT